MGQESSPIRTILNRLKPTHKKLIRTGEGFEEYVDNRIDKAEAALTAYVEERELQLAKRFEKATAEKFDQLCEKVRTDPNLGNTHKSKKDNFLDGAESMVLIPSIIRHDLEAKHE